MRRVSRQAEWGLRPIASVEEHPREPSPEAAALGQALRGLKALKPLLMTFVRQTPGVHEVMQRVHTHGWSAESIPAWQERRGA